MLELLKQPWPWYVAGVLIGLTVPALLLIGNKSFGISSSLRHICAACIPANIKFFQYDWRKESWNLFFVGGVAIGGMIASFVFSPCVGLTAPQPSGWSLKLPSITGTWRAQRTRARFLNGILV